MIEEHAPARIATLGGECAVSVAPFSALARRYGNDLAVVWIDSHPDIGTPASEYPGFHAMAVAVLTGHGDPDLLSLVPATVSPDRVALVGLHEWTEDDHPNVAEWGIRSFSPDELRESALRLLEWLAGTQCSRVAIHFDVDTIDSNEIVLGLGAVPGGLTSPQVRRLIGEVTAVADVVGLTIAEFFPRQVMPKSCTYSRSCKTSRSSQSGEVAGCRSVCARRPARPANASIVTTQRRGHHR